MKKFKETMGESRRYREAMTITHYYVHKNGDEFAVCPKCGLAVHFVYQKYCDNCGQRLKWTVFDRATPIYVFSCEDNY